MSDGFEHGYKEQRTHAQDEHQQGSFDAALVLIAVGLIKAFDFAFEAER